MWLYGEFCEPSLVIISNHQNWVQLQRFLTQWWQGLKFSSATQNSKTYQEHCLGKGRMNDWRRMNLWYLCNYWVTHDFIWSSQSAACLLWEVKPPRIFNHNASNSSRVHSLDLLAAIGHAWWSEGKKHSWRMPLSLFLFSLLQGEGERSQTSLKVTFK